MIEDTLARMRDKAPLVHNITNFVVMQVTANALLAAGASPLMAHAVEELDDLLAISSALVLNIGTLDEAWIAAMHKAGACANARGVPVALDPVGAGASRLRTQSALALLESVRPAVLRGNASEIMALAAALAPSEPRADAKTTKGVDSANTSHEAAQAAEELARRFRCVVSVSGEIDRITDGDQTCLVRGGSPLMTRVTGLGCSATALTGACLAVAPPLAAATSAMALMAHAGTRAAAVAKGPGSFLPAFLDALAAANPAEAARQVWLEA